MTQGKVPFYSSNHIGLIEKIENSESIRLSVNLSSNAVDLLNRLLKSNPEERISFKSLFSHPWITGKNDESITVVPDIIFPNEPKHLIPILGFARSGCPDISALYSPINHGYFSLNNFDCIKMTCDDLDGHRDYQQLNIILSCHCLLFDDLDFRLQFLCKIASLVMKKFENIQIVDSMGLILLDKIRLIIESLKSNLAAKNSKYPLLFRRNLIVLAYLILKKTIIKNMQKNTIEASKLSKASTLILEFLDEKDELNLEDCP